MASSISSLASVIQGLTVEMRTNHTELKASIQDLSNKISQWVYVHTLEIYDVYSQVKILLVQYIYNSRCVCEK